MAAKTSIEWTQDPETGSPGASWNPIRARDRETGKVGWFCVHESDGCRFCYAEAINRRLGTGIDFKAQNRDKVEIFLDEKILVAPLHWRRPRRIFPNSMTDWMADFVPDEWRDRMMAVMALCPQHTFLPLTKRAERMRDYASAFATPGRIGRHLQALANVFTLWQAQDRLIDWPLPNVWKGVSVEDQPNWDERWPRLAATPAAVRWISYEPALGPLNIDALGGPDWLVIGGESGSGARPFDLQWARNIIFQCREAGVSCFVKQLGARPYESEIEWVENIPAASSSRDVRLKDRKGADPEEWTPDLRVREYPAQEPA